MKKQMLIVLLGFSLLNCQKQKAENPPSAPTEVIASPGAVNKTQTATNSLDYLGTYKGTLPCADCAGIETLLELTEDFNYTLTAKYKGKADKTVETKGTFRWNADETAIILENIKNAPNQYLVGNKSLTRLDKDGKKVDGKLARRYILNKIPEAEAAKRDAKNDAAIASQHADEIVGVHWKLIEIDGHAVRTDDPKGYFLELKPDNNFKAYAGCNNMSGHYEYRNSRIRFMRVVGTMKFCNNANQEESMKRVLETADNFVREGKTLIFRTGEMVTAKFEAAK